MEPKTRGSFFKKFKHQSVGFRRLFLIVGIIYSIVLIFFTKSILSLVGIETHLRIIGLSILYLFLILFFFIGILLLFTGKKKGFIAIIIIACLIIPVLGVGSYYIDKTYNYIDSAQKKFVEYKSVMISLNDTLEYNKIGIISSKEDPTGYIIPKEMIKKYNITGELIEYSDYISMISDLYDGLIDAMFVTYGYVSMFNSYEKFEKIADETRVIYEMSKEMENVDNISYSTKNLTEPFTILLMGVDSTGDGLSKATSFNGDTLMLISFNPKTLSSTVFSIPRDTYVPITCMNNTEAKINSSAYGGTSCVVDTIEKLTGITIDYYVKINFNGVVKLVDDLGGIKVDVPISFCEQDSKRRKKDKYKICLEKGRQTLNGEQALALARHRKTLPFGDFQRVQHQQLVVEAMANALKNIKDIDSFYKILNDAVQNIDTNMKTSQILSLYQVGKNLILNKLGSDAKLSIVRTYLTGYDLYVFMPGVGVSYTFQYYKQSLDEIVKAIKVNLELIEPKIIKTFSWNASEKYTEKVIGKTYYNEVKRQTLPNFVGKSKSFVSEYATNHNLQVTFTEVNEGDKLYNSSLSNGTVVYQKEHSGLLVDKITSLNVSIINKKESEQSSEISTDDNSILVPNFVGKSVTEFYSWKQSLEDVNITLEARQLSADDILGLGDTTFNNNVIYKQSSPGGSNLLSTTSFIVYYYKELEEN